MPARSNEFQKLVAIVQRALAPKGAKIVESKVVESLGAMREIDVLIEAEVGPFVIRIAVEAKAHARPLDVNVIEEYAGRYSVQGEFKVDQVVIVSASGFTKSARRRAKHSNIKLLTLTEATEAYFAKLGPKPRSDTLITRSPPILEKVHFDPPIELPPGTDLFSCELRCRCCGKSHRSVVLKARHEFDKSLRKTDLGHQLNKAGHKAEHAQIVLRVCAHKLELLIPDRPPIATGTMVCTFSIIWKRGEWKTQIFRQEDDDGHATLIRRMAGTVGGQHIEMVMPEGQCPERIILNISADDECEAKPAWHLTGPVVLERTVAHPRSNAKGNVP